MSGVSSIPRVEPFNLLREAGQKRQYGTPPSRITRLRIVQSDAVHVTPLNSQFIQPAGFLLVLPE